MRSVFLSLNTLLLSVFQAAEKLRNLPDVHYKTKQHHQGRDEKEKEVLPT